MKRSLALLSVLMLIAADKPPVAPVDPVVDDYFGIKVTDPYRYLENLSDPRTQSWMKGQADYARSTLDNLPDRAKIRQEIETYVNAAPALVADVRPIAGGRIFFLKTLPGGTVAKLYMRQGLSGADTLLVDSDRYFGPNGEAPAINYFEPSPDGKFVAYGISVGGSEEATIHILDVDARKDLAETIDRAQFGGVNWRPDGQSFFYNRLQKLGKDASPLEKYENSKAFLHILRTSADQDVAAFGIGISPRVAMQPVDDCWIGVQPGSSWAVGGIDHGTKLEHTIYAAPLASVGQSNTPWVKVCDVDAAVTDFVTQGDDIYLMTHKDAPNFKIVRTSMAAPDFEHAQAVVPAGNLVLRGLTAAQDALYVTAIDDGIYRVLRVSYVGSASRTASGEPVTSAAPTSLALPFDGAASVCPGDTRVPGVMISLTGWTKGPRYYSYDPQTNSLTRSDIRPSGPYDDLDELTSEEVKVPSWDGALVPLSIVHEKNLKLDGTNPAMIDAYGGYGITLDPGLGYSSIAWFRRGGILAVAHVRGGGEKGENWHKGAFKLTKPNVWRDLIACGQYMVDKKYTSPSRLGIFGGSNGGITMGRALTERPDLFAAVGIRSGLMDSVRFEHDPNGPDNIFELGSVSTQEGFEDSYAMDAYLHVRDGVAYPAVLLTTGINDPRVQPWSPAKMAARLQAATSSGKPILLSVDYQGGHGIGQSKKQSMDTAADMFAFFLNQFGK